MSDLSRFHAAHADPRTGFAVALRELRAGRKRGHWIWYIFPQLQGLGSSPMAAAYGLQGVEEATAYLHDRVLCARLVAVIEAIADHLRRDSGASLEQIMGSAIDARKVVSSMTLFGELARRSAEADEAGVYVKLAADADAILAAAARDGIGECEFTKSAYRTAQRQTE